MGMNVNHIGARDSGGEQREDPVPKGTETSFHKNRVPEVPGARGDILTRDRWALACQDSTPAHAVVNKFG